MSSSSQTAAGLNRVRARWFEDGLVKHTTGEALALVDQDERWGPTILPGTVKHVHIMPDHVGCKHSEISFIDSTNSSISMLTIQDIDAKCNIFFQGELKWIGALAHGHPELVRPALLALSVAKELPFFLLSSSTLVLDILNRGSKSKIQAFCLLLLFCLSSPTRSGIQGIFFF